jgi:hypothetical protein
VTSPSVSDQLPPWSRAQIRDARKAPLASLLVARGYTLSEQGGGNFAVRAHPGLVVKESYWRWPARGLAGNAIDFCTQVLRLSFHEAMRTLTAQPPAS